MEIKGWVKSSFVDYPGKAVSTLFLGGCNFRCPYCQNPELIEQRDALPSIPPEEILAYLEKNRKWLDGVCVSGGEPTIHGDLPQLLAKFKEKGFLVKLDTNGSNPEMLRELIEKKLVDYVAMDIKGSSERYAQASGVKAYLKNIMESAELIKNGSIDYEFRTTVVPGLVEEEDVRKIGEWLKGAKRYYLQQFRPEKTLDKSYKELTPYPNEKIRRMVEIGKKYFEFCGARNI